MLEENDGSVCLFTINAVNRPGGITEGAKPFLNGENRRAPHAGVEAAVVQRLGLQMSYHSARFNSYRSDASAPACAEHTP